MRKLGLAGVTVTAAVALVPGPALAAEPGSAFASYTMLANAPGLGINGLYRDVALTVPETTSSLSTGGVGAALATLAWPGPIVGNLGTTILVLRSDAPPQVTMLNDPVRAEARSGGEQKGSYSLPGTAMTASATNDVVSATSKTSAALPLGSLGGFTGTTRTAFEGAGKAVGTASGIVTDLDLGVVHIGSLVSTASATTDGTTSSGKASTVVSGMTIAGVPVTVDDKGVHVQGTTLPLAAETVTDALKASGITVLLTKPRTVQSGGTISVDAGALVVMMQDRSVTLGRASVGLAAGRGAAIPSLPVFTPPPSSEVAPPVAVLPRTDSPVLGSAGAGAPPPSVSPPASVVATVQAAVVDLARGASGIAIAGLLAVGGLLVLGMRRLPDRVLAVTDSECDEWPA